MYINYRLTYNAMIFFILNHICEFINLEM